MKNLVLLTMLVTILIASCGSMEKKVQNPSKPKVIKLKPKFTPMSKRLDLCIIKYVKELDMSGKEALEICNSIYRRKK